MFYSQFDTNLAPISWNICCYNTIVFEGKGVNKQQWLKLFKH